MLLATTDFVAYKDGHEVCDSDGDFSVGDSVNEGSTDVPLIGDQDQENVNQSYVVLSNLEHLVWLEVFDSAPRKWAKIDLPKRQQAALKRSHDMLVSPVDVTFPLHQLFQHLFDDDVIEYLCQQAYLYASFNGKMNFVDKDEMRAFIAILLSGHSVVPPSRMMWQESESVHNSVVSQLMNSDRFNEILR